jgi:O-antigen/teichoic acid export membrane protein
MAAAIGTAIAREGPVVSAPALRVSFSWTLGGNLIYAVCQFGILSALAKLGNASIVGRYALALAITAPVFMLTNLQLRGVQATDARNEFGFADYFTLRTVCTLLGVLVIVCITGLVRFDVATKVLIVLVACAKGVETISDVIAGHLQKFERLDKVARSLIIRGIASLVAFASAFWYTRNLLVAVAAQAAAWMITVALYDFRVVSGMLGTHPQFFHFCWKTMRSMVLISWPLGLVMTMVSLNTNLPRYILEKKLGAAGLGIFASLAYLLTAIGLIVVALGQSVCTRMSKQFAAGDARGFHLLLTKLIGFAAFLGVAGVAFTLLAGRPILTIIFRPQYADHVDLLLVMVGTASLNAVASFLGFAMTAARCFRAQLPILGATVVTTLALTVALVPHLGLMGAGYALFVAAAVQSAASYLVLKSAINTLF